MSKKIHTDNYYYDIVRNNIKKQRKKLNWSQQDLADNCGLTLLK